MFHNAQLEPTLPTDNVTHVTLPAHHARMPLLTAVIHALLDSSFQMETHVSTFVEVDNTRAKMEPPALTAQSTVLNVNQAPFAQPVRTHLSYKEELVNLLVTSNTITMEDIVQDVLLDVLHAPQPHNANHASLLTCLVTESVPQDALVANTSSTELATAVNQRAQLAQLLILVHHVSPTYSSPLITTVYPNALEDTSEPTENARLVTQPAETVLPSDLKPVSHAPLDYFFHRLAVFNSAQMATTTETESAHHATQPALSAETLMFVPLAPKDSSTTEDVSALAQSPTSETVSLPSVPHAQPDVLHALELNPTNVEPVTTDITLSTRIPAKSDVIPDSTSLTLNARLVQPAVTNVLITQPAQHVQSDHSLAKMFVFQPAQSEPMPTTEFAHHVMQPVPHVSMELPQPAHHALALT